MKTYQTEFKLEVATSFFGCRRRCEAAGAAVVSARGKIHTWVSHYRLHGIDGLRPKRSAHSAQFKLLALSDQDRAQLSSRQVAAVYDIRNPNHVVIC